ncbi:chromate transporter [Tissierella praeacuta DSM 18095]|uniref:Chromate transporter n=1 Tax=Tissierella praeacuta DSM 18095 TaxID=1123404 RepID=A0A1M4WIV0_9FIRM|nr:chromate transporter [Tissierella praeacuta]TCU79075.1 chromate transporter [Tissierella praeacuta]SHE80902.1 chromate transporter [Tissierella praeacuta DSM 18095]SUO99408.1 chromate transporter, chromate ion transporter (CHR) family [Tissierella praeacuta]
MTILKLFISFLKIGAFSFGGGYAMLPLIQKEIIEVHNWLTLNEFIDILAVVEMTPGPVAINSATFLGYKVGGILGSIVATIGVVLPSIVVILIIAHFLSKFKNSPYVEWAFKGIRPVVLGLIISASLTVSKNAIVDIKTFLLGAVLFYLTSFKKMHPILTIIIAGIVGAIIY